jgi:Cof subfamily protein (haloacid dehalogenase superfamily)
MSIKLVAIDMDGTLLNSHHQITPRVKKALQQARKQGVHIVLCTGRPIRGIVDQVAELGLNDADDYSITYNGSLTQKNKNGEIIDRYGLSYDDFLDIEVMSRRLGVHLHTTDEHAIYTANRDISRYTVHEAQLINMPLKYRTTDEMSAKLSIIKMMFIDEPKVLDAAIPKIPAWFAEKYNLVKSAPFYLEVLNKQVSKGNAVAHLAKHLGYTQDEVMAIGDNENDLSMIEYAKYGVAMANAIPLLKNAANIEVADNDHDGVAEAVEKYVLAK